MLFYTTPGTVGSSATAILESGLAQGQTAIADDVISIPMARCQTCVEEQGRKPGDIVRESALAALIDKIAARAPAGNVN